MACEASLELNGVAHGSLNHGSLNVATQETSGEAGTDDSAVHFAAEPCNAFKHKPVIVSSETKRLMRLWSENLCANEDEARGTEGARGASIPTTPPAFPQNMFLLSEFDGTESTDGAKVAPNHTSWCDRVFSEDSASPPQVDFCIDTPKANSALKCASSVVNLEEKELHQACISALKVIRCLDARNYISQCREKFIRKVFSAILDETYHQLQEKAAKELEANSDLLLSCKVVRGNIQKRGIKDSSKLYISLGMVPHGGLTEGGKAPPIYLVKLKEKGTVKEVLSTTATETQIWNETFKFDLPNGLKGCLLMEARVEEKDEIASSRTKIHVLKKIGSPLVKRKGGLIGCAVLPLKDIVTVGEEQTFDLTSHHSTEPTGAITVKLDIHGREMSDRAVLHEYDHLLRAVIAHENTNNEGKLVSEWNGQLSDEAMRFLTTYSSMHHLSVLEQTAKLLSVLMDYRVRYGCVQITEFQRLIVRIQTEKVVLDQWIAEKDALSSESNHQLQHLLDDLKALWTCIVEFVRSHLMDSYFGECAALSDLEDHLLVLNSLHAIEVLTLHRLDKGEKQFLQVLRSCIQTSVTTWFNTLAARVGQIKGVAERAKGIASLCEHSLNMCQNVYNNLQPIFLKFDVDCYSVFFVCFEELLAREIRKHLAHCCKLDEATSVTYNLYRAVTRLLPLSADVNPSVLESEKMQLSLHSYHCWFHQHMGRWLGSAHNMALSRVKNYVTQDTEGDAIPRLPDLPMSACLVDYVFDDVALFWKHLQWPDKFQSCQQCIAVIDILCKVAIYYATILHSDMERKWALDPSEGLHLSCQVCLVLNGIEHVRGFVKNIPERLELESFWSWLESEDVTVASSQEQEDPRLCTITQLMTDKLVAMTDGQMLSLLTQIVQERICPAIYKHFLEIASSGSSVEETVHPLMKYLMENVVSMNKHVSKSLFLSIMENLWMNVLQQLRTIFEGVKTTKMRCVQCLHPVSTSDSSYQNLYDLLDVLSDFFFVSGECLTKQQINSEEFQSLRSDLHLASMTTDHLAAHFCMELSLQQVNEETLLGTLHFSHRYMEAMERLEVEVLLAQNLISGKTNSYVELLLLPNGHFPDVSSKVKRTAVLKSECNPAYNESFSLAVDKHSLAQRGSVLLLVVRSCCSLAKDKFLGMCILNCGKIHHGEERKLESLPLFQFTDIHSKTFKELQDRKQHATIQLCRLMKKLVVPQKYFH